MAAPHNITEKAPRRAKTKPFVKRGKQDLVVSCEVCSVSCWYTGISYAVHLRVKKLCQSWRSFLLLGWSLWSKFFSANTYMYTNRVDPNVMHFECVRADCGCRSSARCVRTMRDAGPDQKCHIAVVICDRRWTLDLKFKPPQDPNLTSPAIHLFATFDSSWKNESLCSLLLQKEDNFFLSRRGMWAKRNICNFCVSMKWENGYQVYCKGFYFYFSLLGANLPHTWKLGSKRAVFAHRALGTVTIWLCVCVIEIIEFWAFGIPIQKKCNGHAAER